MNIKIIFIILMAFALSDVQAQHGEYPKKEGYISAKICEVVDSSAGKTTFKINKIKHKIEGKKIRVEKTIYIDLPSGFRFASYLFDGKHSYFRFLKEKDEWIVIERLGEYPISKGTGEQECPCERFEANRAIKDIIIPHKICKSVLEQKVIVYFINFDRIDNNFVQDITSSIRGKKKLKRR